MKNLFKYVHKFDDIEKLQARIDNYNENKTIISMSLNRVSTTYTDSLPIITDFYDAFTYKSMINSNLLASVPLTILASINLISPSTARNLPVIFDFVMPTVYGVYGGIFLTSCSIIFFRSKNKVPKLKNKLLNLVLSKKVKQQIDADFNFYLSFNLNNPKEHSIFNNLVSYNCMTNLESLNKQSNTNISYSDSNILVINTLKDNFGLVKKQYTSDLDLIKDIYNIALVFNLSNILEWFTEDFCEDISTKPNYISDLITLLIENIPEMKNVAMSEFTKITNNTEKNRRLIEESLASNNFVIQKENVKIMIKE